MISEPKCPQFWKYVRKSSKSQGNLAIVLASLQLATPLGLKPHPYVLCSTEPTLLSIYKLSYGLHIILIYFLICQTYQATQF